MNRMLINATHKDQELRIALANGQRLNDLIIWSSAREEKQSGIYSGTVTRVEPSLEAAFIDYGEERHGFLPLKEVARTCFHPSFSDNGRRPSITEVLKEGQQLLVQVEKEERGNKGAALTTFISLPGCYLVLMPNNPRAGGVSRRIEGDERDDIHGLLSSLTVPEGMGIIIRTAGSGRSQEELQWDLDIQLRLWDVILRTASSRPAPFLIYQEGNAVIRALRDYLRKDIDEILIDQEEVFHDVINHLKLIRPDFVQRVKSYKDDTPLFTRFQIESQIESAFQREVRLPSGGSVIIDHTEAMVSIDINSAKSTKGSDIEETAFMTNLEAADEIARQLRLRDIGGLIVIDFIDMSPVRNQREVEDRLRNALSMDRARVQTGRISRFGLLEMSRQRLRPSLGESTRVTCPRCTGQGSIRGIESLGLSIMRIIEEEALKDNTSEVRAILPAEVAAYLLNEKRQAIIDIEKRQSVTVVVVPSTHLLTPHYEVVRIRTSDLALNDDRTASYLYAVKTETSAPAAPQFTPKTQQEPAIKSIPIDEMPAPQSTHTGASNTQSGQSGLLKKIYSFIFEKKETTEADGSTSGTATSTSPYPPSTQRPRTPHNQRRRGGRFNNNRNRGGRNRDGSHRSAEGRPERTHETHSDQQPRQHTQHNRPHHHGQQRREQRPPRPQQHHEHAHTHAPANDQPVAAMSHAPAEIRPHQLPVVVEEIRQPVPVAQTQHASAPVALVTEPSTQVDGNVAQQPPQGDNRRNRHYHARRNRHRSRSGGNRPPRSDQPVQAGAGEDNLSPPKKESEV